MQQDAFECPTCIPRLFRRLDWKTGDYFRREKCSAFFPSQKSTSSDCGKAHHLRHVLHRVRAEISFSFSTIRVGGHERATISAIRLVKWSANCFSLDSQFSPCRQMLKRLRCRQMAGYTIATISFRIQMTRLCSP